MIGIGATRRGEMTEGTESEQGVGAAIVAQGDTEVEAEIRYRGEAT